jgi:diguanylate cyclase (GGDEF)-like protein/PAS domain S-box-containing protein
MANNHLSEKIGLAAIVFICGLIITIFISFAVKQSIEQKQYENLTAEYDQVTLKIQERLNSYALILRGGSALFDASQTVERTEWQAYVHALKLQQDVDGIQGIGFAQIIPYENIPAHVAQVQHEGYPNYNVHPLGKRDLNTSIVFLEPFTQRNQRAFGYDMYSEAVRKQAMAQAAETGTAALSGKVTLQQETNTDIQAGVLMYVPVYKKAMPLNTHENRYKALIGWVYSPYRMDDLMAGILENWTSEKGKLINLHIYDGDHAVSKQLLYQNKASQSAPFALTHFYQQRIINFNQRHWLITFSANIPLSNNNSFTVGVAYVTGIVLTSLMCGLLLSLFTTQIHAEEIAQELTHEIKLHEQFLIENEQFKQAILNSMAAEIAVLDKHGIITAVNEPWQRFAQENAPNPKCTSELVDVGCDYLAVFKEHSKFDEMTAFHGIKAVLSGELPYFSQEYPCHSPHQQRWFLMTATPLIHHHVSGAVITHVDISQRILAEEALKESENRFRIMADNAPVLIWVADDNQQMLYVNKVWLSFTGNTLAHELGHQWQKNIHPEDVNNVIICFVNAFHDRTPFTHEFRLLKYDHSYRWLVNNGAPRVDAQGHFIGFIGSAIDITERKLLENQQAEALERLQKIASRVPGLVYQYRLNPDGSSSFPFASEAIRELYQTSPEAVSNDGSKFLAIVHPDDRSATQRSMLNSARDLTVWQHQFRVVLDNDTERWFQGNALPEREEDGATLWHGFIADITERKLFDENEHKLVRFAYYDALTNLPNRVLLADRLEQGISQAKRLCQALALVYLDLDGFKAINDNYGHDAGDQLLISVAEQMKNALREGDTLARIGGDEFIAVLPNVINTKNCLPILERLLHAASEPVKFKDDLLIVSASLGVSFYQPNQAINTDTETLMMQADQAMYKAKVKGKNCFHFYNKI